jgi:hypothetical protein
MSEFTLRRPVPPPSRQQQQDGPNPNLRTVTGIQGQVPFRPGDALHESETRDLVPFGWKQGDPIPGDFAERLSAAREEVFKDIKSGKLHGVELPPLKTPGEIPVEKLPPEKQAEMRQLLDDWKTMAPQIAAQQARLADLANVDPSIRNMVAQAANEDGIEIFDSRKQERPAVSGQSGSPEAPEPGKEEKAAVQCPNCLWELGRKVEEPSVEDKAAFTIATFGGSRFLKMYKFMGEKMIAVFRALTSQQANMVSMQLSHDQLIGRVNNIDDFFRLAYNYRMVLSLTELQLPERNLQIGKAVEEIISDPATTSEGEPTALPGIVEVFRTKPPFDNESMWRILTSTAKRFHELIQTLENRAEHLDF